MGQPVKLSEALVLDARLAGEITERSIASQIEFWARLGRAIEVVLRTDDILRLKQRGGCALSPNAWSRSVRTKAAGVWERTFRPVRIRGSSRLLAARDSS